MEELKSKIGEEMFDCLMKANITSLESLLRYDRIHLKNVTSLSQDNIKYILDETAKIILGEIRIVTADKVPAWDRISTGCKSIDSITRGGIPVNGIAEIFGCGGVGKTQFCLQLSLMAQLNKNKGRGVIFLCTEEVFPTKRFIQLAEFYRQTYKCSIRFEDNVHIEHIANYEQLRRCLYVRIPRFLQIRKISLIVIDSIAGAFRSENDEASFINRSQEFMTIVTKLNRLCTEHHIAIVCTNQSQIVSKYPTRNHKVLAGSKLFTCPDRLAQLSAIYNKIAENIEQGKTEPCLGLAWSNLVNCRFSMVRYNESTVREFEVVFAPDLPEMSCQFEISEHGLVDVT